MATIAYFMPPQFVKDHTFIDENVDEKYIKIAMHEAQTVTMREYLGSGLYDDLQTKGLADITYSAYPLYATLVNNYIVPALMWWTVYEAAPFLKFKFTNKSIVTKNSDNSTSADIIELEKVMKSLEDKARFYTDKMVKYLIQNQASFPLYINPGNGIDTIYPNKDAFDSDIYLGGRGCNCLTPYQYHEQNQKEL